eukprot:scpid70594/ scgid4029/ Disintegrin and metalloproteinase domain-containing protein 10; Kuzbanian protein homolog; Mammalian disintegrin-metalloprotease; Myelin-associated metalloproteinase
MESLGEVAAFAILVQCLAATVIAVPVEKCHDRRPLDEHIQHYEPVHYDLQEFGKRHRRAVDSVGRSEYRQDVMIHFRAHDRHFHLRLRPDTSDLTSHAEFHLHTANGVEHPDDYDPNSFLVGRVEGDAGSFVSAFNDDGIMSANIHCSHGSYYLKPARDHFSTPQAFHSVMYRQDDISTWPVSMLKNETMRAKLEKQSLCGVSGAQHEHFHDVMRESEDQHVKFFARKREEAEAKRRTKRQDSSNGRRFKRFVCTLALYADYHFFSQRASGNRNRAISIMRQHVNKAINIYAPTDFDDDGQADGFLFKIGRITVVTDVTVGPFSGPTSQYHRTGESGSSESIVSRFTYLQVFSAIPGHEQFCESIAFTYLDFKDGVLGLAYLQPLGICADKNQPLREPVSLNGVTYRSYTPNSAFVTFVNHGTQQNDGITEIVFGHELGHNWGSAHDDTYTPPCTPGATGAAGNYIMYSRASDGTKSNNARFSSCSRRSINQIILRLQKIKPDCFSDDPTAFCGNRVVEDGEECDCGSAACDDPCCNSYNTTDRSGNCKINRAAGSECSPNKGECCTAQCKLIGTQQPTQASEPAAEEMQDTSNTSNSLAVKCGSPDSCQVQPVCTGKSAQCPMPQNKPDNSLCTPLGVLSTGTRRFRQACLNGFCSESACAAAGLSSCSCGTTSCELCCRVGERCVNTNLEMVVGANGVELDKVHLAPGYACNNFNGQCDSKGVCRDIDLNTALNGVNNLFTKQALNVIAAWLKDNWFWVIIIIVVVALIAVAVHFTY